MRISVLQRVILVLGALSIIIFMVGIQEFGFFPTLSIAISTIFLFFAASPDERSP